MASRLTINTNSLNVPFVAATQYRITLDAGFVKEVGNNRTASPANNNLVTFTTNTAPTFSASSPANDAFDVENNTTVQLTFNRNMEAGPGTIQLYQVLSGVDTLLYTYNMGDPAFVTISNTTVTLKTTGLLEADSAYYLIIDNNAIRDLDNFNYAGSRIAKTITVNGNAALNSSVTKWSGVDSVIFDGVGDYLSVPSSADFGYGTGAFEISAWIRPTTSSQTSVIVDHRPTATEGLYPTLRLQSGVLQYYTNSAVRITGTTITPNTWTFVQVARFSGVTRLYVNGVQVGADYTDSNTYPTAAVKIGVNGVDLSAGFEGYMSDILIKKAPIGLGGFRTRSSVNDDYTVLAIVGNFNDLNSTIFFDTQEEALGFPSLSAAITGAFTPTMTVRYTARGQIVMASSIGLTVTAMKIRLATATLSSTFTIVAEVSDILKVFSNMTTNIIRIRPGLSAMSLLFSSDIPISPFVDQTNGYTTTFIPQDYPDGTGTASRLYELSDYTAHSRVFSNRTATQDYGNYYLNSSRTAGIAGSSNAQGSTVIFVEFSSGSWNKTQTILRTAVGLNAANTNDLFGDDQNGGVALDDSNTYAAAGSYQPSTATHRIHTFSKSGGVWDVNQNIVSTVNLRQLCMSGDGTVLVAVTAPSIDIYTRSGNTWTLNKQYNNNVTNYFNCSVSSNGNTIAIGNTAETAVFTKSGTEWVSSIIQMVPNILVDGSGLLTLSMNRTGSRIIRNNSRFILVFDLIAGPGFTLVSRIRYNDSLLPQFTNFANHVYFGTAGLGFTSTGAIVNLSYGTLGPLVTFTPIP
jgi:hypothetical protein